MKFFKPKPESLCFVKFCEKLMNGNFLIFYMKLQQQLTQMIFWRKIFR